MPKPRRPQARGKPLLYVEDVLRWADEYRERTGRFPTRDSGRILGCPETTWSAVDNALHKGRRGLPSGSSLAKLLMERRGHRHHFLTPRLTANGVLCWADEHRRRTGAWPTRCSGPVADSPGETWSGIDRALKVGGRGLRVRTSLAALLAKRRGRPTQSELPPLTPEKVLHWAEAYRRL
jgi:hypothetical protein